MSDDTDQGARTVRPGRRRSWSWVGLLPFFVLGGIFVIAGVVLLWPRRVPSSAT